MYPYKIIWDLDLYSILITVGLIACMILIRVLSDKRGLSAKWQNFILVTMVFAVVIGYGSAVVFQALYNMERDGGFHITKSTGQTSIRKRSPGFLNRPTYWFRIVRRSEFLINQHSAQIWGMKIYGRK